MVLGSRTCSTVASLLAIFDAVVSTQGTARFWAAHSRVLSKSEVSESGCLHALVSMLGVTQMTSVVFLGVSNRTFRQKSTRSTTQPL